MFILAFDTATPAVTVAVHDGYDVVAHESAVDARRHGELLAPSIAAVLAKAGARPGDVTAIAVGTGPGPYTGLRVGLVTARVLGEALGVPVDGVCTLDIIAARGATVSGRQGIRRRDRRQARRGVLGAIRRQPGTGCPIRRSPRPRWSLLDCRSPARARCCTPEIAAACVIEPRYPSAVQLALIARGQAGARPAARAA